MLLLLLLLLCTDRETRIEMNGDRRNHSEFIENTVELLVNGDVNR